MVLHQVVLQRVPSLTASTIFTIAALNNRNTYFNDEPPSYRETYQPQYAPPPARRYFQLRNQRQIGIVLLGVGIMFTFLGMMLFFEKNLLKFGNIFFLAGLSLIIGPERVLNFFAQPNRIRAAIIYSFGVFLVFTNRPRIGIICQIFGILNIFGNMFPLLLAMARQIPIIGNIFRQFDSVKTSFQPDRNRYQQPRYYPQF